MKKLFASGLASVILLALGICLFINPLYFISLTCTVLGAVLIAAATIKFLSAYKTGTVSSESAVCVVLFVLGIILVVLQGQLLSVIPLTVGICFLVYGILKFKTALTFKNINKHVYSKLAYSALIGIILAVLIIMFHGLATDVILRLIGALLIYNAIENIFSAVVSKSSGSNEGKITGSIKTEQIEVEFHESGDSSENSKE